MSAYEIPNRTHLIGCEVKVKLHPWAAKGPKRGIFLGQGERGLSIRAKGGGRHIYYHAEVKSIRPVRGRGRAARS
ncbi:hypothetical protein [Streptomyces alfalfae]|uniref:hypothetical protein n=1 Tax=Streptomyces alfalfae TaxID=1642299 RepID=UPI0028114F1E|nr:hypothetical protein [Streptomyces alfalfae]